MAMDIETLKEFRDRMVVDWFDGKVSSVYDVELMLNDLIVNSVEQTVTGDSEWSMNLNITFVKDMDRS